ncbi:bifunctional chorismate mutase/prephenate dehydrogenase [Aliidiomarina haloalkalitolerans]|uniref:T-protein n=1 Tax=Aliidiomarina haloalkalitolerans TaxID=859059 RepID=A0A432VXN0_9GAMM|nr:bifunctional chorismate mutase/prephenate dehydrogenase [Aliidiomarina haloalkalitolerans]RUO21417.1 bifunctional chorismate mutase/prephenate dehydrogenase [Aliidiomarina haloalkalitolerans]
MDERLKTLRDQIDATDSELVQVLAKRMELSRQIGEVKQELGQPLYVPAREAALISARREEAENAGLSGDLVEDVLRRTMRESYLRQRNQGFQRTGVAERPVVVIGGKGQLGSLFVRWFELSQYRVIVIDQDNLAELPAAVMDAALVLVSVPVAKTIDVIQALPNMPDDCILADLTSVKNAPLAAMMAHHSGPVLGLHPMFGPSIPTFAKQTILVTPGRDAQASQWLLRQFEIWGVRLHELSAERHDRAMSVIQVMRHLSTFVYGYHLVHEDVELDELVALSSPIYRLELMMVGRLFAQSPELYADIILSDRDQHRMIRRYLQRFQDLLTLIETEGREAFIREFADVAQWFGPYARQFLQESAQLLQHADDVKHVES